MKKSILITLVVVFVLSMGVLSFAETNIVETPEWFNDMITWKKDRVQEAVDNDLITEQDAKLYNERLDYMEEYHQENDFGYPGGCGGFGRGVGRGPGAGMMGRGWGYQGF